MRQSKKITRYVCQKSKVWKTSDFSASNQRPTYIYVFNILKNHCIRQQSDIEELSNILIQSLNVLNSSTVLELMLYSINLQDFMESVILSNEKEVHNNELYVLK